MTSRGLTKRAAERFLLGQVPDDDPVTHIRGRLSIPYLTPAGPWHIKYRDITDSSGAKYVYDGGEGQHMFNAQTLLTAERVVITEGELDAIAVETAGANAVGVPGATQWRAHPHWRWAFDSLDEAIIVADGDDPGRDSAKAIAQSLRDVVPGEVRIVYLPDGEDSNSLLVAEGDIDFLERLDWL